MANAQTPEAILHEVFGYTAFRSAQADIVEHVVGGGDALVLMPTGGGKSLCYQVPAIARNRGGHGVCVVVSPLIALMQDQVDALELVGVHARFLNSSLSYEDAQRVERELEADALTLVYVAPERVNTPRFLELLKRLYTRHKLGLFAIDEAHCVSQWGHDFRSDYLALSVLPTRFPGVPRIALTATADRDTRAEIIARLHLEDARIFLSSFDRPNIRYAIAEKLDARAQLLGFLEDHQGEAGVVYCQSRKKVEETVDFLREKGVSALPYHAGLDSATRKQNQTRFLREEGLCMVATIAFGMGIDKPDVRFVAHLDLPKSVESYYQETGRAGRDGRPAEVLMLYGMSDVMNQRRMIDDGQGTEDFKRNQRRKLDALLALCEAADCRRVRLLAYFDEASQPCGNCDNCLTPPGTWDATEAARKALSCVYRFQERAGQRFGAGHLIDVLRGKETQKVIDYGHRSLSTFGIGAELSEAHWRTVIRQLLALGYLDAEGEFQTLYLTQRARPVLRGEVKLELRVPAEKTRRRKRSSAEKPRERQGASELDAESARLLSTLKAFRAETARERSLPAYVIFHDATLEEMARRRPRSLAELGQISGVGEKKLEAYGAAILRILS